MIADDEPKLAEYLASRLAQLWPALELCGIATNGNDALAMLNREKPDVAFLDIKMPGLSGLEVARRMVHPCLIVFVTAYQKYAITAFEEAAVDYLLKPVADDRLRRTLVRIQERIAGGWREQDLGTLLEKLTRTLDTKSASLRYLRASAGRVTRLIPLDDVLFITARAKYTFAVTKDGEFLMRTPLSELQKQLDPDRFWRIHRSVVVNVAKVVSINQTGRETHVLTLRDYPQPLPVSRTFLHQFKHM